MGCWQVASYSKQLRLLRSESCSRFSCVSEGRQGLGKSPAHTLKTNSRDPVVHISATLHMQNCLTPSSCFHNTRSMDPAMFKIWQGLCCCMCSALTCGCAVLRQTGRACLSPLVPRVDRGGMIEFHVPVVVSVFWAPYLHVPGLALWVMRPMERVLHSKDLFFPWLPGWIAGPWQRVILCSQGLMAPCSGTPSLWFPWALHVPRISMVSNRTEKRAPVFPSPKVPFPKALLVPILTCWIIGP